MKLIFLFSWFLATITSFAQDDLLCPAGTQLKGKSPPEGLHQYCVVGTDELKQGPEKKWQIKKTQKFTYKIDKSQKNFVPSLNANYERGKAIGTWYYYDAEGRLRKELQYENGKIKGPFKSWERGVLVEKGYLVEKGNRVYRHQTWKRYYKTGVIKEAGKYSWNIPIGQWTFYHPNGNVQAEESYSTDGRPIGTWREFSPPGQLVRQRVFQNFVQIKEINWFKNGRIKYEGINKDDFYSGAFTTYSLNGQKTSEMISKNINGAKEKFSGTYLLFHPNGKVKLKSPYKKGVLHGPVEEFSPQGKLENKKRYQYGQKLSEK